MSDVIRIDASVGQVLQPVPVPEDLSGGGVSIRDAVEGDIPFIDVLQKANNTAVGFMPHAQLAGHIEQKHVLIAESGPERGDASSCARTTGETPIPPGGGPVAVGYCIGVDKYFKREDVGVIYQMNVVPGRRRGLVAAALLRAMFERSAYGVKLYCCWCAQDLSANRFWEAMGFVPLAFRTGSRKKSWKGEDGVRHKGARTHIFWQKRIRAGDEGPGATPWWFPSQTGSGAMREDRIVLPIPPGTHWSDAKPAVLPGVDSVFGEIAEEREAALKTIGDAPVREAETQSRRPRGRRSARRSENVRSRSGPRRRRGRRASNPAGCTSAQPRPRKGRPQTASQTSRSRSARKPRRRRRRRCPRRTTRDWSRWRANCVTVGRSMLRRSRA